MSLTSVSAAGLNPDSRVGLLLLRVLGAGGSPKLKAAAEAHPSVTVSRPVLRIEGAAPIVR